MGGREAGRGEPQLAVVWQVEWTNKKNSARYFASHFVSQKGLARKEVAIASFTFLKATNRYVRLLQVCPNGQIFLLAVWTLKISTESSMMT